jgi:hypothetical protein
MVAQENMQKRLHRFTSAIIWEEAGQIGRGTGFLVSSNLIITVAHNLFNRGIRVGKEAIKIYVGAYGELKNPCTVQKVYIPEEYLAKKLPEFDYSLIKLNEKVEM